MENDKMDKMYNSNLHTATRTQNYVHHFSVSFLHDYVYLETLTTLGSFFC